MTDKKNQQEKLIMIDEIEEKIFLIRGRKVMLDSDLAEVYNVTTKRLNEQVKRNIDRFPEDFMFQLTEDEFTKLRNWSQFATSSAKHRGTSYRPYAFTEHGAVMLASVLKSQVAIEASIKVVRAFVKIRSILALHQDLADRIEELGKVTDFHEQEFEVVFQLLDDIMRDPKYLKGKIGFVQNKGNQKNETRITVRKIRVFPIQKRNDF